MMFTRCVRVTTHFDAKNAVLRPENTVLWDYNSEISNSWFGPTPIKL